MQAEVGTAAACSKVRFAGLGASMSARAQCVLGEGAVAGAEDLVARLELRHVLADRLDRPRDIHAPNASLGRAEPEAHDAHQVGLARHHVPVTDMDASRVNAHEHVVVARPPGLSTSWSSRTSAEPYLSWTIACIVVACALSSRTWCAPRLSLPCCCLLDEAGGRTHCTGRFIGSNVEASPTWTRAPTHKKRPSRRSGPSRFRNSLHPTYERARWPRRASQFLSRASSTRAREPNVMNFRHAA